MIIIGIAIGVILTIIIIHIQHYLKANHLVMNWKNLFIALVILLLTVYLIYSFIGIAFGPKYTKSNGNVCKGYKYGIKVCSGDINAE